MSKKELCSQIKNLRELIRMADEINAEIEAALMSEQGVDTLTGDDFKVTWKAVSSNRLDSKALKAALPDVYSQFCKTTTSKRFTIA